MCAIAILFVSCGDRSDRLVGSWVQPIPGQENKMQGVKLEKGGKASSINMHTLVYESWDLDGDKLILSGKSIGNAQTIQFSDTLIVDKIYADKLVLQRGDHKVSYVRE